MSTPPSARRRARAALALYKNTTYAYITMYLYFLKGVGSAAGRAVGVDIVHPMSTPCSKRHLHTILAARE